MTKTILITGATSGFGRASARRFAEGGWRVIGTGRRAERLRDLGQELGDAFLPLEIDMRDQEAVENLAKLSPPWGDIDLLLNNAGLAPPTTPLPSRSASKSSVSSGKPKSLGSPDKSLLAQPQPSWAPT